MKKSAELNPLAERSNLDFSKGVRGKHYERAIAARHIVVLDADLLDAFPDSAAVNRALRSIKEDALRSNSAETART